MRKRTRELMAKVCWVLWVAGLGRASGSSVEGAGEAEVRAFYAAVGAEAGRTAACRAELRELLAGNVSALSPSFGRGPWRTYESVVTWGIDADRWIARGIRCQRAAWDMERRMSFCYARQGDGRSADMAGVCLPDACLRHAADPHSAIRLFSPSNGSLEGLYGSCLRSHYDPPIHRDPSFVLSSVLLYGMILGSFAVGIFHWSMRRKEASAKAGPASSDALLTEGPVWRQLLLCWSTLRSVEDVVRVPRSKSVITCLWGIRSAALFWVILGHSEFSMLWNLEEKAPYVKATKNNPFFLPILQFTLSVDMFLVLSGLLNAYNFLRRVERKPGKALGPGFWLRFYRHRLLRIWPAYAAVVFFMAFAYIKVVDWPMMGGLDEHANCQANWYLNLAFLNHLVWRDGTCMIWTWYLGTEMTLFLCSPLLLWPLLRRPKVGVTAAAVLIALSMVARGLTTWWFNFPAHYHPALTDDDVFNQDSFAIFSRIYTCPHTRLGSYVVGILLGYLLSDAEFKAKFRAVPLGRFCLWSAVAGLGGAWAFVGAYWSWNGHNEGFHFWHNLVYVSAYRTVFAAGLGWWVAVAHSGRAAWLGRALSWRPWLVIANLSYAAYLAHPITETLVWLKGLPSYPFRWAGFPVFLCIYAAQVLFSISLASTITLAVELPIANAIALARRLRRRRPKPADDPPAQPPNHHPLSPS